MSLTFSIIAILIVTLTLTANLADDAISSTAPGIAQPLLKGANFEPIDSASAGQLVVIFTANSQ